MWTTIGQHCAHVFPCSGLDPAEPYFQAAGASVGLDTSDAAFVDVIHTDGLPFSSNLGTRLSRHQVKKHWSPMWKHDDWLTDLLTLQVWGCPSLWVTLTSIPMEESWCRAAQPTRAVPLTWTLFGRVKLLNIIFLFFQVFKVVWFSNSFHELWFRDSFSIK